jgi:hypothetical protein
MKARLLVFRLALLLACLSVAVSSIASALLGTEVLVSSVSRTEYNPTRQADNITASALGAQFERTMISRYDYITRVRVDFGRHIDHCEEKVWFLIAGHLRSLSQRLLNLEGFIKPAKCYFLVVYTRDEWESTTKAWWKNASSSSSSSSHTHDIFPEIRELFASQEWLKSANYALAVTSISNTGGSQADVFGGVWLLQRMTEQFYGLSTGEADVFVKLRPDLLFSHTLHYSRLTKLAAEYSSRLTEHRQCSNPSSCSQTWRAQTSRASGFGFFVRHESSGYIKDDPSELFWVANKAFMEALFQTKTNSTCGSDDPAYSGCFDAFWQPVSASCSTCYVNYLIHRPNRLGHDVFYIGGKLKIHILRMNGDFHSAINRPGDQLLASPHRTPLDVVDITTDVLHVMTDAKDKESNQKEDPTLFPYAKDFGRKWNGEGYELRCWSNGDGSCGAHSETTMYRNMYVSNIADVFTLHQLDYV